MNVCKMLAITLVSVFGLMGTGALAANKLAILDVPELTASVWVAVREALVKVPGVIDAKASCEPKEALVTYDDTKTNPQALMKATEQTGYPSTLKGVK